VLFRSDAVAFAHVDGDHSTEGAAQDIQDLLESPACQHTVILVHDSYNAEVRAGIEQALPHPAVVYHDLDFVRGPSKLPLDEQWGGFALIVTGPSRQWGHYSP
jgi:hypothetical protein